MGVPGATMDMLCVGAIEGCRSNTVGFARLAGDSLAGLACLKEVDALMGDGRTVRTASAGGMSSEMKLALRLPFDLGELRGDGLAGALPLPLSSGVLLKRFTLADLLARNGEAVAAPGVVERVTRLAADAGVAGFA